MTLQILLILLLLTGACSLLTSGASHLIDIFPCGVPNRGWEVWRGDLCDQKVYQSVLHQSITLNGTGFADGLTLTLNPPLSDGTDYTLEVVTENRLVLHLSEGKKWRREYGALFVTSIQFSGTMYTLGREGAFIASISSDPVIRPFEPKVYYETHSRRIDLIVDGFPQLMPSYDRDYQDYGPVDVVLSPTPPGRFTIFCDAFGGLLTLTLQRDLDAHAGWLPADTSFYSGHNGANESVPLYLVSISTGAGVVPIGPLLLGHVIKDREDVLCTNTCKHAYTGACNDGTLSYRYGGTCTGCEQGTDCEDCSMQRILFEEDIDFYDDYANPDSQDMDVIPPSC